LSKVGLLVAVVVVTDCVLGLMRRAGFYPMREDCSLVFLSPLTSIVSLVLRFISVEFLELLRISEMAARPLTPTGA
jgi:hypothetical protein